MEDQENPIVAVGDALLVLTYAEMLALSRMLCDMQIDSPRDLATAEGWAELLNDWAESVEESLA